LRNCIIKFSALAFILFLIACKTEKSKTKEKDSSTEERLYLGQEPLGLTPEPFIPGLVTTGGWEFSGVFSPDMKEFYFLRKNEGVKEQEFVVYIHEGNKWNQTVISSRQGQPFISLDGKTMHLGRRYKERKKNGNWSEIKKLGTPFDSLPIMRLTASSKGTYFSDEFKEDFTGDIRYLRLLNGKYEEPKLLGKKINTGKSFHPFIAPDESYLLFDSKREGGYGDSDIYISFRQQNGSWGNPINLVDKINTKDWEASASVTPDGKYLFFNRNMGSKDYENVDIFWVSTEVIEKLRHKQ
jgi:Tol biopolymer transport system component